MGNPWISPFENGLRRQRWCAKCPKSKDVLLRILPENPQEVAPSSCGLTKDWCSRAVSLNSAACCGCGTGCAAWRDCTTGVFLQKPMPAPEEHYSSKPLTCEKMDSLDLRWWWMDQVTVRWHLTGHLSSTNADASWCDWSDCRRKGVNAGYTKRSIRHKLHEAATIGPATHLLWKAQCQPRPTKRAGAWGTSPETSETFKSWMCWL